MFFVSVAFNSNSIAVETVRIMEMHMFIERKEHDKCGRREKEIDRDLRDKKE